MDKLIDFVNIASTGNAVDFGDAVRTVEAEVPTVNSPTRIVYGQYGTDPGTPMTIEYVTTSTSSQTSFCMCVCLVWCMCMTYFGK